MNLCNFSQLQASPVSSRMKDHALNPLTQDQKAVLQELIQESLEKHRKEQGIYVIFWTD